MNAGRPAPLWPGRPRPLPGETFSSWFARVAATNGLLPDELYEVVTLGSRLHSRDLDRLATADLLEGLSARTGIKVAILADATLARWAGHIYDPDEAVVRLPWLPSVGTERTRPSYGQQFCPHCLAEDRTPYFRLRWRLHFVTACEHHHTILLDRCPGCHEPIHPLKSVRAGHGIECHKCGTDLATDPTTEAVDFVAQQLLLTAASQACVELPGHGQIHPPDFFQLILVLLRLIAGGPFAQGLRTHLAAGLNERNLLGHTPRMADLYRFDPGQRHILLRIVVRMLDDWPHRFHAACHAAGISRWQLERTCRSPFTLLKTERVHVEHQPTIAMISPN